MGVMFPNNQCDYIATTSRNFKESKHEGIRYACDQCDYSATTSINLKQHRESKHEGVK